MTEETTEEIQKPANVGRMPDGTFAKGYAHNPKGKVKGTKNLATRAAELLLDGEAENLTRKAIELGLAGDTTCLRLCMEKILPSRKDRPVNLEIPTVKTLDDVANAMGVVVEAVANAEISPSEGSAVTTLLQSYSAALEMSDLAKRIEALEARSER